MEFAKKIEEIKFNNDGVSEPIAMASASLTLCEICGSINSKLKRKR